MDLVWDFLLSLSLATASNSSLWESQKLTLESLPCSPQMPPQMNFKQGFLIELSVKSRVGPSFCLYFWFYKGLTTDRMWSTRDLRYLWVPWLRFLLLASIFCKPQASAHGPFTVIRGHVSERKIQATHRAHFQPRRNKPSLVLCHALNKVSSCSVFSAVFLHFSWWSIYLK